MGQHAELTVMAFDYGTKRIGVAVGQTISRTATPLEVIANNRQAAQWTQLSRLIDEWRPDLFVIGMPRYDDEQDHPLAVEIERFSRRLQGRYSRAVQLVDEHLSSYAASDDPAAQTAGLDAAAARVILLTWMNQIDEQPLAKTP